MYDYLVWLPEEGETADDAERYRATEPEYAAELWARHNAPGLGETLVRVLDVGSGAETEWLVIGETEYRAEPPPDRGADSRRSTHG